MKKNDRANWSSITVPRKIAHDDDYFSNKMFGMNMAAHIIWLIQYLYAEN